MKGLIFVLSGPSGSGKTTLRDRLLERPELKKVLVKSVSLTTRPRRSGEKDKKDYFFVSELQFKRKLKAKKILEWTKFLGYYYATPKDFLEKQLKAGKNVLLCLDLKGASRLKDLYPDNAVTVFILPPSVEILRRRIEGRCVKTKEAEISRRLELAGKELNASSGYDYCVVNKSLNRAVVKLLGIILKEARKGEKLAV